MQQLAMQTRSSTVVATRAKAPLCLRPDAVTSIVGSSSAPQPAPCGRAAASRFALHAVGPSKGGVLDAPTSTASPGLEKGIKSIKKRSPIYRVMLHNDNYNRREYVVRVLVKVVEGMTKDDAIQVMQEAHETGMAMVLACPQEEAEQYCETLRLNGLMSSIEPGC